MPMTASATVLAIGTTDGTLTGQQAILKTLSDGTILSQVGSTVQTADLTSSSSGVVVPAFSVVGAKSFNLFTQTTSTILGAQVLTLEISPSDTVEVWFPTTLTITPSLTSGALVLGTVLSTVSRRARVKIASTITSGTFSVWCISQGN